MTDNMLRTGSIKKFKKQNIRSDLLNIVGHIHLNLPVGLN